jgi:dTDP-4-amino-4,6-dideoxygalactose transaminase
LRGARWTGGFKRPASGPGVSLHREKVRAMANLDASIALAQLEPNPEERGRRFARWERIAELVSSLALGRAVPIAADAAPRHLTFLVPVDGPKRESVLDRLRAAGIGSLPGYRPLHLDHSGRQGDLRRTEELAGRVVVLPLSPGDDLPRALTRAAQSIGTGDSR